MNPCFICHLPVSTFDFDLLQKSVGGESCKSNIDSTVQISKKLGFFQRPPVNLRSTDFKLLVESLLSGSPASDPKLLNVMEVNEVTDDDFSKEALTNYQSMILWQNFQVSQWCVNNKLKTTIGKAQDTLTSFSDALRQRVTLATQNKVGVVECRRILMFFDLLEKSFVNAADGCSQNW